MTTLRYLVAEVISAFFGARKDEIPWNKEWLGMAGRTGLEPATSGLTGQRSNQLNYRPRKKGNS
jgi:hypothetical protein